MADEIRNASSTASENDAPTFLAGQSVMVAEQSADLAARSWTAPDVPLEPGVAPPSASVDAFKRKLGVFARRIRNHGLGRSVLIATFFGVCASVVWLLVDRILIDFAPATIELTGLVGLPIVAALIGLLIGVRRHRSSELVAAVRADEAVGGRERISTALATPMNNTNEAFSVAVWRDAVWRLDSVDPKQISTWRWPWQAPVAASAIVLLIVGGLLLPSLNLLAGGPDDPSKVGPRSKKFEEMVNVQRTTRTQLKPHIDEMGDAETQDLFAAMQAAQENIERQMAEEFSTDEQADARAQMSALQDKIEERQNELQAAREAVDDAKEAADAARERGNPDDRNNDGQSDVSDGFQDAMEQGDFEKAADELQDLYDSLSNDEMTPEQRESLQNELEKMYEQMQQDSQMKQDLGELLDKMDQAQQQGNRQLTPQELESLQSMKERLEKMENMQTLEANEELLRMLEGQCEQCEGMLSKLDEAGQPGEGGQSGQPGEGLSEEELQAMVEAMRAQQGNLSQPGQPGNRPGTGNQGQGGAAPGETEIPTDTGDPVKPDGQVQPGDILTSEWRHGRDGVRNDTSTQYDETHGRAAAGMEEALTRDRIPLERRSSVREYFDRLNQGRTD